MATLFQVMEALRMRKMDNEFRWEDGTFNAGRGKTYAPGGPHHYQNLSI